MCTATRHTRPRPTCSYANHRTGRQAWSQRKDEAAGVFGLQHVCALTVGGEVTFPQRLKNREVSFSADWQASSLEARVCVRWKWFQMGRWSEARLMSKAVWGVNKPTCAPVCILMRRRVPPLLTVSLLWCTPSVAHGMFIIWSLDTKSRWNWAHNGNAMKLVSKENHKMWTWARWQQTQCLKRRKVI